MKRSEILNVLPTEIWFYIYRIEHNIKYLNVVKELKDKVLHIVVDNKRKTFIVCSGENQFSCLVVF